MCWRDVKTGIRLGHIHQGNDGHHVNSCHNVTSFRLQSDFVVCKIFRFVVTHKIIQGDDKSDVFCVIVGNLLGDKSAK